MNSTQQGAAILFGVVLFILALIMVWMTPVETFEKLIGTIVVVTLAGAGVIFLAKDEE